MNKLKVSLGIVFLCLTSALITFFTLMGFGVLKSTSDRRPLTIELKSNTGVYDGNPVTANEYVIYDGKLRSGERIEIEYINGIVNAGTGEADANVHIIDQKGFDVSTDYKISFIRGTIEVLPRAIELKTNDCVKEYDGTPISGNGFTITEGSLVSGHKVYETFVNAPDSYGSDTSSMVASIYDINGHEVTSNYDITYIDGIFTINKCGLTLKTASAEKEFDGSPLECDEFEVVSGYFPKNGKITATTTADSTITFAGKQPNRIDDKTVEIYDEHDVEITQNYIFSVIPGVLEVTPYTLYMNHKDATHVYDGTSFKNEEFTLYDKNKKEISISNGNFNLFDKSFSITIDSATEAIYYGTYDNIISPYITLDGTDTKESFDVILSDAKLYVTKRDITVVGITKEEIYNGLEKSFQPDEAAIDVIKSTPLVVGDTISVSYNQSIVETNYGEYEVPITDITLKRGDVDVYNCYNITVVSGTLSIGKRKIEITGDDLEFTFNGNENCTTDINPTATSEYTKDHITIEYKTYSKIEDNGVDNVFTVTSIIDDYGEEQVDNYEVTYIYGKVKVNKLSVNLTIESNSKVFDGEDMHLSDCTLTDPNLPAGYTATFQKNVGDSFSVSEMINASASGDVEKEVSVSKDMVIIYDREGNEVTNTFNITLGPSKISLCVTPCIVKVNGDTREVDYDYAGEKFYDTKAGKKLYTWEIDESTILPESCSLVDVYSNFTTNGTDERAANLKVDVGTYEMKLENVLVAMYEGKGLNQKLCKIETKTPATVIIKKINLTITTASYTGIYDEAIEDKYFDMYECFVVLNGETFDTLATFFNDVGVDAEFTYQNEPSSDILPGVYLNTIKINDSTNINLTIIPGTITITKKDLYVYADNQEINYKESQEPFTFTCEETITLNLKCEYSAGDDCGKYTIYADYTTLDDDTKEKYNVIFVNGTLTVNKLDCFITIDDANIFFGDDLPALNVIDSEGLSVFTAKCNYSAGNTCGTYKISLDYTSISQNILKNYTLHVQDGTLTVNKLDCFITIDDANIFYRDSLPTLIVTDSVGLSIFTATCNYSAGDNCGTYKISLDYTSVSQNILNNYTLHVENGTLTVNKRTYTVIIQDENITTGSMLPDFSGDCNDGTLEDSDYMLDSSCDTNIDGSYAIFGVGINQNCTFIFINGTIVVQ